MAAKQDEPQGPDGVAHSFRVVHVMRPSGQLGGGSEVSTGHLNAHDAMDWIRGLVGEHNLSLRAKVHPAYGLHPADAAQLLPEADGGVLVTTPDAVAVDQADLQAEHNAAAAEAGGADASAS